LIVDLDFYDLPAPGDDVQLAWRRFLGKGPMVWSPRNGGHWVPTRAEDISALHRDTVRLSNRDGTALPVRGGMRLLPTEADPPEVEEYRRTVLSFFSPRQIDALEPLIRALARQLIDAIAPQGGCEFVGAISQQLPIVVFLQIMALPLEDRTYLLSQSEQIARNPDNEAKGRAMHALVSYIESRVTERRNGVGDDVISTMARARIGKRPLRHDEIVSICTLLFGGWTRYSGGDDGFHCRLFGGTSGDPRAITGGCRIDTDRGGGILAAFRGDKLGEGRGEGFRDTGGHGPSGRSRPAVRSAAQPRSRAFPQSREDTP
jgi:hypothetical protein